MTFAGAEMIMNNFGVSVARLHLFPPQKSTPAVEKCSGAWRAPTNFRLVCLYGKSRRRERRIDFSLARPSVALISRGK